MEKAELVFIPLPVVGHLISSVELAKLLLQHDQRLSITVLILKPTKFTFDTLSFPEPSIANRINFVNLPEIPPADNKDPVESLNKLIHGHIFNVKQFVNEFLCSNSAPDSPRLAGFVVDMFCTAMKDVADGFGVATYVFFTCSASYLDLELHLQNLLDEQNFDPVEFQNSDSELNIPSCLNPVPFKVLPDAYLKAEYIDFCLSIARGIRQAKGILVNSYIELESRAIQSLQSDGEIPTVYPVGPILNLNGISHYNPVSEPSGSSGDSIIRWLDDQSSGSVLFLCFGSMGMIVEEQVMEFASALENSGTHFLWSLRMPRGPTSEKEKFSEILPKGFLDRTAESGRVIGWAPQVEVLAHRAVGGFISHCGWNSALESIHFGVPVATLSLYAEQQFNAFLLVKEFGLGVEIRMDYRRGFAVENEDVVSAEEIEKSIRAVMEKESEVRKKVKEMSEVSQKTTVKGGSSYSFLTHFVDQLFK